MNAVQYLEKNIAGI